MAPTTTVRLATCVVAASLLGAGAATLPAGARADDGSASVPESPAAVPSLDAGAVLAGEASAAVESAIADALGGDGQAAGGSAPADATSAAAPAAETVAEDTPVDPSTPEPEASVTDTTPVPVDTAPDIAPPPAAPATPAPVAPSQSSPSNVNVSVRIASPGDNGPVTQVNVAASGASSAPPATTVAPAATAATTGSASSAGGAAVSPPVSQPAAGAPSSAQDDPGTWSWQWNCLSMPDFTAISSGASETGALPKNWTWIWNCGGNSGQYQDATASQYQPTNVNVAIRISSPGNDGPVSQANVAVAVAAGAASVAVAAASTVVTAHSAEAPAIAFPGPSAVSDAVLEGTTSLPSAVAPASIRLGGDAGLPSLVDIVDLPYVLPPLLGVGMTGVGEQEPLLPGPRAVAPTGHLVPAGSLELGTGPSGGSLSAVAGADGGSTSVGTSTLRAREKPVPRWRAPRPRPMQESVPSGASFAPATGGGSSGGGIPIFLALPFLAAMLDLARRVALDRVALPSGHRSRMPENPG
jgi:hypothetical protein